MQERSGLNLRLTVLVDDVVRMLEALPVLVRFLLTSDPKTLGGSSLRALSLSRLGRSLALSFW